MSYHYQRDKHYLDQMLLFERKRSHLTIVPMRSPGGTLGNKLFTQHARNYIHINLKNVLSCFTLCNMVVLHSSNSLLSPIYNSTNYSVSSSLQTRYFLQIFIYLPVFNYLGIQSAVKLSELCYNQIVKVFKLPLLSSVPE